MFNDIDTALAITKQYAGIAATDFTWDLALENMLEQSRSPDTPYRVFIVAAMQLWSTSASSRGQLISADGASWLTPKQIAESLNGLLAMQAAIDSAIANIPAGWGVDDKRKLLCGCETITIEDAYSPVSITG